MGKTTEDIKISLDVSLTGSPKGVVPTKIFEIKIFILKFAKNTLFYPKIKNWHFHVKNDVWAPTVKKSHRKPYLLSRNAHFAIRTLYRLFVVSGELSRHFSLLKGWPLFLALSMCLLLAGKLCLHDFVCDRVLFSLNKEFFRYYEKTSFWGKKSFFGNSRFS